ncbi:hypothetical protein ACTJJB_31820 [Chitinophaga sp. 22536]|uniref:hypothetical protein n=1 Tax=unclassified Chitinophaga TaxID=2619133 RepID=UPI003F85606D
MPIKDTEVYKYLEGVKRYFDSDLKVFYNIMAEAENKENETGRYHETTSREGSNIRVFVPGPDQPRCAIPLVQNLFSVAELLGFLLRDAKTYYKSEQNLRAFFQKADEYKTWTFNEQHFVVGMGCFRNGMAHNYYPKLELELSFRSSNPTGALFFKGRTANVVLNVNELSRIIDATFAAVLADENAELYQKMDTQMKILTIQYENEVRTSIDTLKATLP